jgi:hypothetical protein
LTGHVISFDNHTGNLTQVIPRYFKDLSNIMQVVFSGPISNNHQRIPKVNVIRKDVVVAAAQWLRQNKIGYEKTTIGIPLEAEVVLASVEDRTVETIQSHLPSHATFTLSEEEVIMRTQMVFALLIQGL